MSSRQLTHIETNFLAKGLNFSITSKTLPNKNIIATIDDAVKDRAISKFLKIQSGNLS